MWDENNMIGHAVMVWPNGSQYKGEVVDGVMEGKGRFTFANGKKVNGKWINGDKVPNNMEKVLDCILSSFVGGVTIAVNNVVAEE